jgi:prepilin-type N-terminal cleavage/methylation domain-containing protein
MRRKSVAERSTQGFSLMEVLVAITIVGIVYATLFSLMSTSLKNIGRIEEHEKLTRLGQLKLNELVLSVNQGKIPAVSSGQFDDKYSWKFHIEPVRFGEILNIPRDYALATIRLSVFWPGVSQQQNEYSLETLTWFSKKP